MPGRSVVVAVGVLGTLFAVVGEVIAYRAGRPVGAAVLDLAIALTYVYGGLVIWRREPDNRTGPLMALIGVTWQLSALSSSGIPGLAELGIALGDTPTALLLILVLAYPSGRFESRIDRIGAIGLAISVTALNTLQLVPFPIWVNVNPNGFFVGVAHVVVITALFLRRWLVAAPAVRRDLLAVLVAGFVLGGTLLLNLIRRIFEIPVELGELFIAINDLAPAAIPVALLIGFYRQSEHRLRALIDALPDPMVRFARDGRYLASEAAESAGPAADNLAGRRLYDVMVEAAPGAARAAAVRALETGDLQAYDFGLDLPSGRRSFEARLAPSGPDEVTAIVRDFTEQRTTEADLRRSRARLVEATDEARRRLERDLHDGAQQRLVSLSLALRMLRTRLAAGGSDAETIAAAEAAAAELRLAIQELRQLARGLHPAILTEAGLGPAIATLADRTVVASSVRTLPERRFSPAVEATAYFVVSEALANVDKHASASSASVGIRDHDGMLRVEVADDGVGGADDAQGSGIRGLRDRVAAVGGRLSVDSPPGQGTLVVAEIPIG